MKLGAELPYNYREHASKVMPDSNKITSNILILDERGGKIGPDEILDTIEGKASQSIDSSESHNGLNAYYLSGKSDPINNWKNEIDSRAGPYHYATSEKSLIAQDLLYMDKTVTVVELPHFSVCSNASSTVKDICVDEGMQMFEKVLLEYDKVNHDSISSLNLHRVNDNNVLMEGTKVIEKSEDLEHSSTIKGLCSLRKLLESDVGDEEFSSPSKYATFLNVTVDKTVKNNLRSSLVAGYPFEQCYSASSIIERPLDAAEITASTLPSEEIIDHRSHSLKESNTSFLHVDSSGHNDTAAVKNQDLRLKFDRVVEEEEDVKAKAVFSPEKANEGKKIVGTVSSNRDLFEDEKISPFFTTSNGTKSIRINGVNGASGNLVFDGVASTSNLESKNTSIYGNENKVVNYQQSVLSQDGVGTEEIINTSIAGDKNKASNNQRSLQSQDGIGTKEVMNTSLASNENKIMNSQHSVQSQDDVGTEKVINTFIAGNENKILNNHQSVQFEDVGAEEPLIDDTSSLSHFIHGESNLLEPANLSGSTATSHIPYSGSLSLRSESSTTSVQSFAFPILQSEWSSSPVRMAKAERRHLRKHRWRIALACCKF